MGKRSVGWLVARNANAVVVSVPNATTVLKHRWIPSNESCVLEAKLCFNDAARIRQYYSDQRISSLSSEDLLLDSLHIAYWLQVDTILGCLKWRAITQ